MLRSCFLEDCSIAVTITIQVEEEEEEEEEGERERESTLTINKFALIVLTKFLKSLHAQLDYRENLPIQGLI